MLVFSSGVLPGTLSPGNLQGRYLQVKRANERNEGALHVLGEDVGSRGLTVRDVQARALGESTGVSSPRGSGVEHFLGKEGVTGSNPVVGSMNFRLGPEQVLKLDNDNSF